MLEYFYCRQFLVKVKIFFIKVVFNVFSLHSLLMLQDICQVELQIYSIPWNTLPQACQWPFPSCRQMLSSMCTKPDQSIRRKSWLIHFRHLRRYLDTHKCNFHTLAAAYLHTYCCSWLWIKIFLIKLSSSHSKHQKKILNFISWVFEQK